MTVAETTLEDRIRDAFALGKTIDLGDACYGPASWGTKEFISRPAPYYHFLAGWCQLNRVSRAIEVGTHFGGSTLSILKGMQASGECRLVTMDVTDLNADRLAREPAITKIVGSGSDPAIQDRAVAALGDARCDLLYVDALKDSEFVTSVVDGFAERVSVGFVILDDIQIVPAMRAMWASMQERFGANAVDILSVEPEIRAENVGFGLIRLTR